MLGPLSTATVLGWVLALTFLAFAFVVVWKIYTGDIDLTDLLSEGGATGKASLSRFQLLLFTYVISGLYLVLCIESGTLIDIPNGVLGLLGISAGSYVVSKGIGGKPGGSTDKTSGGDKGGGGGDAGQSQ